MYTSVVQRFTTIALAAAGLALASPSAAQATTEPEPSAAAGAHYEVRHNNQFGLILSARDRKAGSSVGLATDNDASDQRWRADFTGVSPSGWDTYRYVLRATENSATPMCLDVKGKSTADGADVVVLPCDGSLSQRWTWRLDFSNAGFAAMQNENSGKFMDVPTGPIFTVNLKQFTSPSGHKDWTFTHVPNA